MEDFVKKYGEDRFVIPLFFLIGLLIYSVSMRGEFIYDDYTAVVLNPAIKNWSHFFQVLGKTRVVTFFTLALNYHIHGLNVFGYHLTNVLIHIGTTIILYKFIQLLFIAPQTKTSFNEEEQKAVALFCALLFLCHPLQTQAVSYIWQRGASLAAFFYLSCLNYYLRARLVSLNEELERRFLIGAVVCGICAVFSKQNAVTLPLMIICVELMFVSAENNFLRIFNWRQNKAFVSFMFSMLFVACVIPIYYFMSGLNFFTRELPSRSYLGDMINWKNYLLTQFSVLVEYLRLFVFPVNQVFEYEYPAAKSFFEYSTLASFLFLIILILLAFWLFNRNRLLSFGIFWFFITMMIESSVFPIRYVIFEHRMYLPIMGVLLFSTVILYQFFKNLKIYVVFLSVIVLVFSMLTVNRNFVWQTHLGFWQDNVKKAPNKWIPLTNLGGAYIEKDQHDQAIVYLLKAMEINPNYAKAYFNMSTVFLKRNEFLRSLDYAMKAYEFEPDDIGNINQVGFLNYKLGNYEEAFYYYQESIKRQPGQSIVSDYTKMVLQYYKSTKNTDKALKYAEFLSNIGIEEEYQLLVSIIKKM